MNDEQKGVQSDDPAANQNNVNVKEAINSNGAISSYSLEEEKEKFGEKQSSENLKNTSSSEESSIFGSGGSGS